MTKYTVGKGLREAVAKNKRGKKGKYPSDWSAKMSAIAGEVEQLEKPWTFSSRCCGGASDDTAEKTVTLSKAMIKPIGAFDGVEKIPFKAATVSIDEPQQTVSLVINGAKFEVTADKATCKRFINMCMDSKLE